MVQGRLDATSPFEQVMVALDLETTGLDQQRDAIIEIGAVKFRGRQVLGTFQSFVNPSRPIPAFITQLTGIAAQDVAAAPSFAAVAPRLEEFVGDAPVVGQNVGFDIGFLANAGLRFPGPVFDTAELASLVKLRGEFSLAALAREFGVVNPRAHRATADAGTTHLVLMGLLDRALAIDLHVLEEMERLASVGVWPMRFLLRGIVAGRRRLQGGAEAAAPPGAVDLSALQRRMEATARRPPNGARPAAMSPEAMAGLLQPGNAVSKTLPNYTQRKEQDAMLRAVASALQDGSQLVVEAGTGVGKSLAYLLPSALHALQHGQRVVVSTATIGLQEQLVNKDLPAVAKILTEAMGAGAPQLRYAQLKGKANYLCVRRWAALRASQTLDEAEARVLGKMALWLQTTSSGDRSELRLVREENDVWSRISAQGAKGCPMRGAPCFYEAARRQADDAHVLVVNHALLLSDLAVGGGLLPPYEHVIIDEAHHLEEEATRQLGFELSEESVGAYLDALGGPRGLAGEAARAFGVSAPNMQARRNITERAAQRLQERVANARQAVSDLFAGLSAFLSGRDDAMQRRASLRVTPSVRGNQEWTRRLELAQESVGKALREVGAAAGEVSISLEGLEGELIAQVRAELDARVEEGAQVTDRMEEFIVRAKNDVVYWLDADNQGRITLHAAPLRVDHLLKGLLFDEKRAVVLTSATLSTAGKLAPIKSLLGAQDATELLLGSPFDFQRLAQVCVPRDVPEPNSPGYDDAVAQALIDVARAARGRTLALFTSYAALRASASRVRAALEAQGIRVLAQGIDGSVAQVLEQFQVDPKALLMGTASFWEGVDLVGDQLQALVVVRLPFAVPSDPVFAARSETYEDAFNEYAVPQAVLKFRQGFGRLVRSPTDRGVVVVLDRRYISRSYGVTFRNSLPPCRMVLPTLAELGDAVEQWLRQKTAGNRR